MQVSSGGKDDLVEVVLMASRVLVGLADQSLPQDADVTLHQFRALSLVAAHDELNVNSLAELLGVGPSTITRLCDRLVGKKLIRRRPAKQSRREVCISVTPRGAALVAEVVARRRAAIDAILARIPAGADASLARGLKAFIDASGVDKDALRTLS